MRLHELEKELNGGFTSIQKVEKCKSLIGSRIELTSTIFDIMENTINFRCEAWCNLTEKNYFCPDSNYYFQYDQTQFKEQLLILKPGDGVEITAEIASFWNNDNYTSIYFNILTINKINSEERRNEYNRKEWAEKRRLKEEADEENYEEAVNDGRKGAIIGGIIGFFLGLLGVGIGQIINESLGSVAIAIIFFVFLIGCSIIGYQINFTSTRRNYD